MKNPTINVLLDAGAAIIIASAFLTSAAPSGIELAAQEAPKWFGDVHELTLVDGTSLAGTITAHTSQVITLITRDGATIGIPVRLIRTIDGKAFPDSSLNAFWSSTGEAGGSGLTTAEQRPLKSQASGDSSVAGNKNLRSDSGESANALVEALQSASWERRSAAARELGTRRQWEGGAIDALSTLLGDTVMGSSLLVTLSDSAAEARLHSPGMEAARALAAMDSRGYDELAHQMFNANPLVRERAAFGLGETGNKSCVPVLLKALKDRDPPVRAAAAGALHYAEAIPQLIKAIDDNDERVRAGAVTALGRIGEAGTENALIAALSDVNQSVRSAAAGALGAIKSIKAVGSLARLIGDPETAVRLSAVIALGKIRDTATVPPLIAALRDRDGAVVKSAAAALGDLRDPRAVEPLRSTVQTCPESARGTVEFALKLLTEVPLLIGALDDRDSLVRGNAEYLLWLITGKKLGYDKRVWADWFVSRNDTDRAKNSEDKTLDTAAPKSK
jgi:HEAT repeat protein